MSGFVPPPIPKSNVIPLRPRKRAARVWPGLVAFVLALGAVSLWLLQLAEGRTP